jgi:quercetin dioxygenase-like cupin family protein
MSRARRTEAFTRAGTDTHDDPGRIHMPSIERPLSGKALHFRLDGEQRSGLIDDTHLARGGRSARTLVRDGALRVTLVGLGPGGSLAEHRAAGPITVHVLSGEIHFRAGEEAWILQPGDLLSVGAGVSHAVESADGAVFLLTVAAC